MSLSAAVLEAMMEKGLSLSDVVDIARLMEAESATPTVSSNAIRQRRFRERKSAQSVTNNVTVTRDSNVSDVSPTPPSDITPFPPLKGGTSPKISNRQPAKPKTADGPDLSEWISTIWQTASMAARKRSGLKSVERALRAAVRDGHDPARIAQGLAAYYASPDATKDGGKYAKGVDAAITSGRWLAFAETEPIGTPAATEDPWPGRMTRWNLAKYWDSDWGPKPGQAGCRAPQPETAEQEA